MHDTTIMRGFPPPPAARATLENWRLRPWSHWAFHHVREVIPTARIAGAPRAMAEDPHDVLRLAFAAPGGREVTVAGFLHEIQADSLVVLRAGRVACEWHAGVQDGTKPHILFSVTKSVAGTLAGILADRGLLDPDAPVTRYVPEAGPSCYGDATVRHLLDMVVSSPFVEDYTNPTADYMRYRRSTAWNPPLPDEPVMWLREFLCTMPRGAAPHGSAFHYLSPNTDMLGWVMERAAGRRFSDLVSEHIWQPLGCADAEIAVDPEGAQRAAGGMCCTPRDLARFGDMMRLGGVAGGRQVVPGWWVDDITRNFDTAAWAAGESKDEFPEGGYRSKWWITGAPTGAFTGIGIHGQWIWCDPSAEVTVALLSSHAIPSDEAASAFRVAALRAICARLAPKA